MCCFFSDKGKGKEYLREEKVYLGVWKFEKWGWARPICVGIVYIGPQPLIFLGATGPLLQYLTKSPVSTISKSEFNYHIFLSIFFHETTCGINTPSGTDSWIFLFSFLQILIRFIELIHLVTFPLKDLSLKKKKLPQHADEWDYESKKSRILRLNK